MTIDNIIQLKNQSVAANNALNAVLESRDAAFEKVREQYQGELQDSLDNRNEILLDMHNEITHVMQNDKHWFNNQEMFKLVSDALKQEGNNVFFYGTNKTPVQDVVNKIFDHKLIGRYDMISYVDTKNEEDNTYRYVIVPNIMMNTSATDDDITSLAELIEPYLDAAREYVNDLDSENKLLSVFEHTLADHGVISVSSPSKGNYKIIKTSYGFTSDVTGEKSLLDILHDIRNDYWYQDDANLHEEDD